MGVPWHIPPLSHKGRSLKGYMQSACFCVCGVSSCGNPTLLWHSSKRHGNTAQGLFHEERELKWKRKRSIEEGTVKEVEQRVSWLPLACMAQTQSKGSNQFRITVFFYINIVHLRLEDKNKSRKRESSVILLNFTVQTLSTMTKKPKLKVMWRSTTTPVWHLKSLNEITFFGWKMF